MPMPFDTHAVIQELEHLGFPTPQAEGLSHVLTQIFAAQDYATKADIAGVRADIQEATLRLEVKIETLKSELHKTFLGMLAPLYVGLFLMLVRAFWPHMP